MSEKFGNLVEGLRDAIATLPPQHLGLAISVFCAFAIVLLFLGGRPS